MLECSPWSLRNATHVLECIWWNMCSGTHTWAVKLLTESQNELFVEACQCDCVCVLILRHAEREENVKGT